MTERTNSRYAIIGGASDNGYFLNLITGGAGYNEYLNFDYDHPDTRTKGRLRTNMSRDSGYATLFIL